MNDDNIISSSSDSNSELSGNSFTVTLDDTQYNELSSSLDSINSGISSANDNLTGIKNKQKDYTSKLNDISDRLDNISSSISSANSSGVEVPDDYYNVMSDLSSQQSFFLSLILGVLICFIFVSNFRK